MLCASSAYAPLCRARSPGHCKGPRGAAVWRKHTAHARLPCYFGIFEWGDGTAVCILFQIRMQVITTKTGHFSHLLHGHISSTFSNGLSYRPSRNDQGTGGQPGEQGEELILNMNAATSQFCIGRAGPGLKLCWRLTVPNSLFLTSRLSGTPARHILHFCSHPLWLSWVEIGALHGKL